MHNTSHHFLRKYANFCVKLCNVTVLRSFQTALCVSCGHFTFRQDSTLHIENELLLTCHLERHTTSYCRSYGRQTVLILVWLTITSGTYQNGGCIAPAFVTSISSRRIWLQSGRCLIRRSSTRSSSSGIHIFRHAFENKDILYISCSLNLLD